MRWRRRSNLSTSETPRSPNLEALDAACQGMPMMPAADETLTRCPPRRASIIGGTSSSMTWIGPIRLTSTNRCQSLCSRLRTVPHVEMPAMFITTSTLPELA